MIKDAPTLNATLDAGLPADIWELICSYLGIEDIKNIYLVNSFFKQHITQANSIWRSLINHHFFYLNKTSSAKIKFLPQPLFKEEFFKWKSIAQELGLPLLALLTTLQGKYHSVDKQKLDTADIKVLTLLNAAVKNEHAGLTEFECTLVEYLQSLLHKKASQPICLFTIASNGESSEKVAKLISMVNSLFTPQKKTINKTVLINLCQEYCITGQDVPEKISVFDKINELAKEELLALQTALEELFVMLEPMEGLSPAQVQVLDKVFNVKKRNDEFIKLCQELFTPEKLNAKGASIIDLRRFDTYQGFIEYLLLNLPERYAGIILEKIQRTLKAKEEIVHAPALLAQFGLPCSSTSSNNTNTDKSTKTPLPKG